MRYRLIALDLDGTLLNSRKEITPRTREALRAARERGIVTVIATGRTPASALDISRRVGGGPVICCNGAGIIDETGAFVVAKGIPQAPLERALEIAREAGLLVECYTQRNIVLDRPWRHAATYMRWVRPRVSLGRAVAGLVRLWHINRMHPVASVLKWAKRPEHQPVLKLMILGEKHVLQKVAVRLQRETPGLEVTTSHRDNLEIMAGGVTKGSGLQSLAARLKIPRDALLAFGDSDNDLEMLRYAGTGVAMGNASAEIKAAADRVTATCDEDGVARVIEEMLQ